MTHAFSILDGEKLLRGCIGRHLPPCEGAIIINGFGNCAVLHGPQHHLESVG